MKYYKFKNIKHSVVMKLLKYHEDSKICELQNASIPCLLYEAHIDELEEIEKGEE